VRALALAPFAVIVVLARTTPATASPEDLFGFGARSAAMGATGTASSAGWDASYANPALLSRVRRNVVAVGLQGAVFDVHADGAQLPGKLSTLPAKGLLVGVAVPVPFGGALRDRVGLGLAMYTPSNTLVRARILFPETPQFPLLGDRAQSLAVRIGGGADVWRGIRVGAGVAVLAQLVGTIDVASASGTVSSRVDDQLVATYAPTFGAAWDAPFERTPDGSRPWRLAAAWRGALQARFDVTVDATKLSTLSLPPLHIGGVAQYDPEELSLEIARERDAWVIAAGATWKRWSAYPGVFEATVVCPSGQSCEALAPPGISFADTIVPRVGVERAATLPRGSVVHLRGGAFFEPSPVPSSLPASQAYDAGSQALGAVPTRLFDAPRAAFCAGAGVDLGDYAPLAIDLFAQWHVLMSRTVQTPPAPAAQLSGNAVAWGATIAARL
jgi:long-chain fatty acid transport protein